MAYAGCDANEAQQKALKFSQVIQEMSQKDPQKYAQAMQELQPELLKVQQGQDLEALCTFYDKALERLK
jgi:predicted negative regulator of RcsB-dependent stress response